MEIGVEDICKEELKRREFPLFNYMKDDNLPCEIEEGLYIGSIGAAHNKQELLRLNITHILSVVHSIEPLYPSDFQYKQIEVWDRAAVDMEVYFDECFAFINEAKQREGAVLVHCFAGKSRSVTVVIAYLMKTYGMGFLQAYNHVRNRRPQAEPNLGFVLQLRKFQRKLGVIEPINSLD